MMSIHLFLWSNKLNIVPFWCTDETCYVFIIRSNQGLFSDILDNALSKLLDHKHKGPVNSFKLYNLNFLVYRTRRRTAQVLRPPPFNECLVISGRNRNGHQTSRSPPNVFAGSSSSCCTGIHAMPAGRRHCCKATGSRAPLWRHKRWKYGRWGSFEWNNIDSIGLNGWYNAIGT